MNRVEFEANLAVLNEKFTRIVELTSISSEDNPLQLAESVVANVTRVSDEYFSQFTDNLADVLSKDGGWVTGKLERFAQVFETDFDRPDIADETREVALSYKSDLYVPALRA